MSEIIHSQAIALILSAMYKTRGDDGRECKFMFGPPGSPSWSHRTGTHVFFRKQPMVSAGLYVRQSGPAYLKSMSMTDIQDMLTKFITEHYGYLSNETFLQKFDCSYDERISEETKAKLADLFAESEIVNPKRELTLYPLVPVKVEDDFQSDSFFIVRPCSLNSGIADLETLTGIAPEEFPPVVNWQGRKERPLSWLGVRSPKIQASNKMKAAILGAVALTPHPRYRHQFSMRNMFGGRFSLDAGGGTTISFGDAHTPAMSVDISIKGADHVWLAILATKLAAVDKETRRQIKALEYFYRAWSLDPSERFPWLFMTLDAIFGDSNKATQAAIEAMAQHGDTNFQPERLKLLLSLRGDSIHGRAPDVYDSKDYYRYYETYGDDPLFDVELITARCLRATIFRGGLVEHPDPYADLIRAYRNGTLERGKARLA